MNGGVSENSRVLPTYVSIRRVSGGLLSPCGVVLFTCITVIIDVISASQKISVSELYLSSENMPGR